MLTHATRALALGQPRREPALALPRRAARPTASSASGCGRLRGRGYGARPSAVAAARGRARSRPATRVRHGTLGEGVVDAGRAGRRRHGAVRGRRRRAPADARVRAAREDRVSGGPAVRRSADELGAAIGAIGQYFGRETDEAGSSASAARTSSSSGCTRRSTAARSSAARARSRSGSRCRAGRRLRRRHGRRRLADASPPRRAARDDARPARRRARARRAARGALGLRGDDLRPLRLRARLAARARCELDAGARRVRRAARAARAGAARRAATRRSRFPARVGRAARASAPGMFARDASLVGSACCSDRPDWRGGGGPKRFAVLELDGAPRGYAIYRHRAWFDEGASTATSSSVARGDRGRRRRRPRELWRYLLDVDWIADDHGATCCRRPPALPAPRAADRGGCATGWATGSGCGSSTSARRCRRGRYARRRRRSSSSVRRRVLPLERGALGARGRRRRADRRPRRICASTSPTLGSAYLGGITFRELARAGRVEELAPGAVDRADALFRGDAHPWCPEIF